MPVSVIVGGQFGSEGKGKVSYFLAQELGATVCVRVGGPNSGHTVYDPEETLHVFKQLPTPALLPNILCVLPAGCYIRENILLDEIRNSKITPDRLLIDPDAVIIEDNNQDEEKNSGLGDSIGSTLSGTGAALIARQSRHKRIRFARDLESLTQYIAPTKEVLRKRLDQHERIIVEGTQGFGLSILHSQQHPYTTIRDTTSASFISEVGLSPLDVDDVVMVLRAFPIRVAGNSGPLPNETTWEEISKHYGQEVCEYTSVTRKLRRIAYFDPKIVQSAIRVERPTRIVLNHVDYIDYRLTGASNLTDEAEILVRKIAEQIGARIDYVGIGPSSLIKNLEKPHILGVA